MLIVDKDIVTRINQGDAKAFEKLYTIFYVYLCAIATKYVYQPEIAKEIVNDVFMNVWNNRAGLLHPVNAYLIRSVQNRCLNHLQRQRMQEVPLSEVQEQLVAFREQQIKDEAHPLAYLENKEFEESIYQAIGKLPPRCRQIFEQYVYQNMTYDEIAQANQITSSTVRTQIQIGLSKLREILGEHYTLFFILFFLFRK